VQKISWSSASPSEAFALIPPVLLASLAAVGVNAWLGLLPAHVILDAAVLALSGYFLTRYRTRLLTGAATRWINLRRSDLGLRERVLIVGAGETGQFAAWRLSHRQTVSNFRVVGFVDDDMFRQGVRLNGYSVLGKCADIPALVRKHDVGLIAFAIHNIPAPERRAILKTCRGSGARVVTWPDIPSLLRSHPPRTTPLDAAQLEGNISMRRDQAIGWLDTLEDDLGQGDYSAALEQIHSLRQALQSKQPPEANAP
jgi:FlaA1/EpsC-like NDP-sugar epimerase